MNTGLLWFDNDPKKSIADKVTAAATYYQHKYGLLPNLAFLNPKTCPNPQPVGLIQLRTIRSILPNHIWIGQE